MSLEVVAGVDSSTQSCKVELRSLDGFELLASGKSAHPHTSPPRSEQDPRSWWSAFRTALGNALGQVPGVRLVAISVAGQCHGLVGLDADHQVVRPAKLWNDTTTASDLQGLIDRIGRRSFIDRTGSLPTAAFTISKLAWLARNEPDNFARLATVLLPHDYLTFRLTGQFVTDRSEASGTGYFDPDANEYLPDFLNLISSGKDWAGMLPRVLGPDDVVGTVMPSVAAELGISNEVLVGPGAGDQHASAVGLGVTPGQLVVALGTSGVVFTPSPEPVRDPAGLVNGVAGMPGGFLPLACTLNAAKVTDTFVRLLGTDHEEMSRLALAADEEGPVLVAFLDGERTPDRPNASGALVGLTTDATREQLARAAYEGVVFGLLSGVEHLSAVGADTAGEVYVVGGGARSAAYAQLLSDALARPVRVTDVEEAVARGAAVQALALATGRPLVAVMERHRPSSQIIAEPRPFSRGRWLRYRNAVEATKVFDAPELRDDPHAVAD